MNYKLTVKKLIAASGMLMMASSLINCAGNGIRKAYPEIKGKGKIALISFNLDKSITEEGAEKDSGPGLLQKKENYYQHHQTALESMYQSFKDSASSIFDGAEFLSFDEVNSNEELIKLTTYAPKKIMGVEITEGANSLLPNGVRYVSNYMKAEELQQIADALGCDLLLIAQFEGAARGAKSDIIKDGPLAPRQGQLVMKSILNLYQKPVGIIWQGRFETVSDTKSAFIGGELNPPNYPQMFAETMNKLYPKIRNEVNIGTQRQKEAEAKAVVADK